MEELKPLWEAALDGKCESEVLDKWWSAICTKYESGARKYHNASYLVKLFSSYKECEDKLTSKNSVILALFFHK